MNNSTYLAPDLAVYEVKTQTVLCQSNSEISPTSLESWEYDEFVW